MTKMINFKKKIEYQKSLLETLDYIENIKNQLIGKMIDLAMLDKWQEWNKKQEEGAIFEFTEEMLKNTGDKNIDKLCEIIDKLEMVKYEITKG